MTRFTPSDLDALRRAVAAAEDRTSGEIVAYVVARSGGFEPVLWRGAAVCGLAVVGLLLVLRLLVDGWAMPMLHSAWAPHAAALVGVGAGLLLVRFVPPAFRLFAGGAHLDRVVHERALRAFVEDEVFDTRDRTGMVLLVSLLERRIEVLGDAGINAAVDREDWAGVVGTVRDGLRSGRPAEAIEEAIRRCGELLKERGLGRRKDDENEIGDAPRIDPELR